MYTTVLVLLSIGATITSTCDLKWVKTEKKNLPSFAVSVWSEFHSDNIYVGKGVYDKKSVYPGYVVRDSGKLYIADIKKEYTASEYEVLTNPNACELQWIKPTSMSTVPPHAVIGGKTISEDPLYIAKATTHFEGGFFHSIFSKCVFKNPGFYTTLLGKFQPTIGASFAYCGDAVKMTDNFEVLAVVNDLDLQIIDIGYNISREELFASKYKQTLLFDRQTVENPTNVSIQKTLSLGFTKSQTFEYSFSEENKFNVAVTPNVGLPLGGGSLGIGFKFAYEHGTTKGFTSTKSVQKIVTIEDKLEIPPRTSIVATGIVNWLENIPITYVAKAFVSDPYMNTTQIKEQLLKWNTKCKVIRDADPAVEVEITGTLVASFGFDSDLHIENLAL